MVATMFDTGAQVSVSSLVLESGVITIEAQNADLSLSDSTTSPTLAGTLNITAVAEYVVEELSDGFSLIKNSGDTTENLALFDQESELFATVPTKYIK